MLLAAYKRKVLYVSTGYQRVMSAEETDRGVWVERYRPTKLNDIKGHTDIIDAVKQYVEQDDIPHLLFSGPPGVGKTAAAVAIAKELYGDDWEANFLELNASDERGIDVVRERIKDFARSSFSDASFRIIFLDEADALTSDAQAALRRTMEQFSDNVRFIMSCNYASQIIEPIQSRCARYRFGPLGDQPVEAQIREIAARENLDVTDDAADALVYAANGDMRRAINGLQAASITNETINEEDVYAITSTVRPEDVEELVESALDGEYLDAQEQLEELLVNRGIAATEIVSQLHRNLWGADLSETEAVAIMERLGETEYRITQGANERVQMDALIASIADSR